MMLDKASGLCLSIGQMTKRGSAAAPIFKLHFPPDTFEQIWSNRTIRRDGINQTRILFPNGYGASIVLLHWLGDDEYEVAVINEQGHICDNPISNGDVLSNLNKNDVLGYLRDIFNLPYIYHDRATKE